MSNTIQQPKQRVVYVRVTKMFLPRSNPNVARNLFQQVQPGYSGVISPLMPIQMLDMYSTTAIPAFRFHDQRKTNVTFIVTELTQFGEKEVCRLCLPISWFPHGYVVHHYFPFITKTPENGTPFIELDVHVADVLTAPFSAYYGTLTVVPTWIPPPQMTEGATVLVPQQVKIQKPVQQQIQKVQQQNQKVQQQNQKVQQLQNQKNKEQNNVNLPADKNKSKSQQTHIDDDASDESEIMLDDLDDVLTDESANQNPPPVFDQSKTNEKQQPRKLFDIPDPEPEQLFEQETSQKQIQKQQPLQQNQNQQQTTQQPVQQQNQNKQQQLQQPIQQQQFQYQQYQQQPLQQPIQQQQFQYQQQPLQQQFQYQQYQQQQPIQQFQQYQQQPLHQQNQYQQQLQQHLLSQYQTTQSNKVHYPSFPSLSNQQEFQEQQNNVETKNDNGKASEEKKKLSNPM